MKGFISILEAFLAVVLIYFILGQIQLNMPTRYSDTANMERLNAYSHDIAFSICGNYKTKRALLNDTMSFDLNGMIPGDVCYRVSVYENSSNNHLLDSLVYNYVPQNQTNISGRIELFYDEFANLDAWSGNKASNDEWFANTTQGYNNSNCADMDNFSLSRINHTQSTVGYSDINISLWYNVTLRDSGEYLTVDWYNGTGWTTAIRRNGAGGDTNWYYNSSILSVAAENNPDFTVRLTCYDNHLVRAQWNYDRCQVDSFRVTGLTDWSRANNQTASNDWSETNISDLTDAYTVAIGDANNDGKNDVVVGYYGLSMYTNTSGGWAYTYIPSSGCGRVNSIVIGDANNDGRNEVVQGVTSCGTLKMYQNISGGWVETNISNAINMVNSVSIGDANNDGANEVVVGIASGSNTTRTYKNTTGKWVETNISDTGTVDVVAVGDVDDDGEKDVVITMDSGDNKTRMYKNMSGGWVETNISSPSGNTYSMAVGDANSDGKNEVIVGTSNTFSVFENISGNWSRVLYKILNAWPLSLSVGDADNNGQNDVVVGLASPIPGNHEVQMYTNTSGTWVGTDIMYQFSDVQGNAIGDANNDGKNEVVIAMRATDNETRMYSYSPTCPQGIMNSTSSTTETTIQNPSEDVYSVATGDANNDGSNEIVIGMYDTTNELRMYQNKTGGWTETNIQDLPDNVYSVAIGDANNDGGNDVVIGIRDSTKGVRMYENKSGAWVETNISTVDGSVTGMYVAIGDVNNDGRDEVVVGMNSGNNETRMYENKSGGWIETNISDVGSNMVYAVAMGDANNDGKNEVVIGDSYTIRMYENKTGGWVETNISSLSTYARSIAIGDANNDGGNDVVIGVSSVFTYELRMYENKTGKWVETNISETPYGIYSVAIGDANNNGLNDIAVGMTSSGDSNIRTYENNSGKWMETNISTVYTIVRSVAIGDVNNDGGNEIVIGKQNSTPNNYNLRMYKNATSTWCTWTSNFSVNASTTLLCNLTSTTPSATSSCLIAGGYNSTNYSISDCRISCGDKIASSNNDRVDLVNGQNFTAVFNLTSNGSMVEFYLEGYHNQSVALTYLYDSAGNQIASYNFSNTGDEGHVFDLSDFYPDSFGSYNITVKTNYNASYDYAYLNVSSGVYSPKRIVVQTWNYGD